jgi:hypothetical protein
MVIRMPATLYQNSEGLRSKTGLGNTTQIQIFYLADVLTVGQML